MGELYKGLILFWRSPKPNGYIINLAQGSHLSPLSLRGFILIIFVFRLNIKPLLFSLEFLYGLYCKLYGLFVFSEKEGLYYGINNIANIANSVVNGNPGREALLWDLTELIITAVVITYI